MRKNKFILLIFVLVMSSCKNEYVLDINNVPELSNAILESEIVYEKDRSTTYLLFPMIMLRFGDLYLGKIGSTLFDIEL